MTTITQPILTANYGRGRTDKFRHDEMKKVRDAFPKHPAEGPIEGLQEIDEADGKPRSDGPGGDEHLALKALQPHYTWANFPSHVPIGVPKDWTIVKQGSVLGHKGLKNVTPHRPITWALLRHTSGIEYIHINSHVVQGAWTQPGQKYEKKRRSMWNQWWRRVKKLVAKFVKRGHTVIFTADTNNPHPPKIHPNEKRLIHKDLDVILAVEGSKGPTLKKVRQKTIQLHIDGHNAQAVWVEFKSRPKAA